MATLKGGCAFGRWASRQSSQDTRCDALCIKLESEPASPLWKSFQGTVLQVLQRIHNSRQ